MLLLLNYEGLVQVKEDSSGNVKIASSHAGKDFAAEEISAQVLRKLTDDAAKFLNDKVCPSHLAEQIRLYVQSCDKTLITEARGLDDRLERYG